MNNQRSILIIVLLYLFGGVIIPLKADDFSEYDVNITLSNIEYNYSMDYRNETWFCEGAFYFDICTNKELTFVVNWHHNRLGTKFRIYPNEYTPNVPFRFGIAQGFKYSDYIEISYIQDENLVSPLERLYGINYVSNEDRQLLLSSVDYIVQESGISYDISERNLRLRFRHDEAPCNVSIYGMTGNLILSEVLYNTENFIDLNYLQSGLYIINLFNKNESITEKLFL